MGGSSITTRRGHRSLPSFVLCVLVVSGSLSDGYRRVFDVFGRAGRDQPVEDDQHFRQPRRQQKREHGADRHTAHGFDGKPDITESLAVRTSILTWHSAFIGVTRDGRAMYRKISTCLSLQG